MSNKIGLIRDKSDLVINITDDSIMNITGMMGSGKSTLGKKIKKDQNIELISLDWLFGYSIENKPDKINQVIKKIESIYKETKNQEIFKYSHNTKKDKKVEISYQKYTEKIYTYLIKNYITSKVIIEGRQIYKYIRPNKLKGTLIIKRTSLFHSYKRAFTRDVFRRWKLYKDKKISRKAVREKFIERIKFPLKDYKEINSFIKKVEIMKREKMKE